MKMMVCILGMMGTVLAPAVEARPDGLGAPETAPTSYHQQLAALTMGDAIRLVESSYGGKVISAQPTQIQGRPAYRIKVLSGRGEVRVVVVDASSGAISG